MLFQFEGGGGSNSDNNWAAGKGADVGDDDEEWG